MSVSRLYFEAHITIDPVFDAARRQAEMLGEIYNFRMAKLILRKREADQERPHEDDSFFTGRAKDSDELIVRTAGLVKALRMSGFVVRRYKIEDTILDSRVEDELELLK